MTGFRIVLRKFGATPQEAFSGESGYVVDGRWHSRGRYVDYVAASRSLATLERLVHYKRFDAIQPHVVFTVEIPDDQITIVPTSPPGWDGVDLLPAAQVLGDEWCDRATSPAFRVPSAVTPGEYNLIVNARHVAWVWDWVVSGPVPFEFESRLLELLQKAV